MKPTQQFILFVMLFCFLGLFPGKAFAQRDLSSGAVPAVLHSASELDYPPFCIVRPDGSADGFSVELLKAVVRAMGKEITIKVGPWTEIKGELAAGQLDVLPLVSYSRERDEVFDFTVPYLQMHGEIFVRKGEKSISSKDDLQDKEVLVMNGDTAHEWAVKEKLGRKLIPTATYQEAFTLLSQGKHDAVLAQKLMGLQLIKQLDLNNIVPVSDPFSDIETLKPVSVTTSGFQQKFCFAVTEGNSGLLSLLNEGLAIVITNGTYERLYEKWFGPILPPSPVSFAQLVKLVLFIIVPALLVLALFGIIYLKREVARNTLHLREEINERIRIEHANTELITELKSALEKVKTLSGFLPICASCKKIRDDKGYWNQIEKYISTHSQAEFTHSICPDCMVRLYGEDCRHQKEGKKLSPD
ncbi:MAG: transporter substrate-binding domain-containing protein [Pseudomonadota bacterium]